MEGQMDVAHLRRLGLSVASQTSVLQKTTLMGSQWALQQNGSTKASFCTAASGGASSSAAPKKNAPKCLLGCCGFSNLVFERNGHPGWIQPADGVDVGLKTFNSLTGEKEQFFPLEGKKVRWYTCGPTVYDVAHMGHARAYLTFDILRRIMSNYFGYDVFYQINITDVDDKIILRSRQNKLFADFEKEITSQGFAAAKKVVDVAVAKAGTKLKGKYPQELDAGASEKDKQEREKLLQEHELKMKQHGELEATVAAATTVEALLRAARDPLMAKLDEEKAHTITDHSIFNAHARNYENEYFEDMDALGVMKPDVVTRVTDYMDGRIQKFIEKMEERGFAYEAGGSVYFSITDFENAGYSYRKLVPSNSTSAAEMAEGEGALAAKDAEKEKRNPNDFALWKKSKPGEPEWDSKWGPGRPGWHIECSVMATDVQGETLDIHAGGEDLKFPHHDNEMAQTEAYLGRSQWVNYFWHAGHLHIEGLKMSKSLKNFITIRQALQMHSARQLRLMFLMQPWDKGMNYSDQAIEMARAEERKLKHFFGSLKFHVRHEYSSESNTKQDEAIIKGVGEYKEAVGTALRDNFNTPRVVEVTSRLVSECYASYEALPAAALKPVQDVADNVLEVMEMLGVSGLRQEPANEAEWTPALDAFAELRRQVRRVLREKGGAPEIEAVLKASTASSKDCLAAAKKAGLSELVAAFEAFTADLTKMAAAKKPASDYLTRCDEVRDKDFVALGVRLEDRGQDLFLWMFDDKTALAQELQERAEKAKAAVRAKLVNKLSVKRQELKLAQKAAIKPQDVFRAGGNEGVYADFDAEGIPSKMAGGEDISAKKKKDLAKELAKQQKDHEKLQKQAGEAGIDALLAKLQTEVSDLEAQVGPEDS
mmetsp:Transcript_45612/g.108544  ORF Transcript_45612/g.108544 Transcript_45612/m.108544 type:complete len:879 (+) Transcript_45612:93-2729(+)